MANVSTIDDSNPKIQYSPPGGWQTAGSDREYNTTTHWTTDGGATATFVFVGTNIVVYGTIEALEAIDNGGPPQATFTVDNSNSVLFSPVPQSGVVLYHQQFYASPQLSNQQHTLVVTKYQDSAPLFLDYLVIQSPTSSTTLSPTPGPSGSTTLSTTGTSTNTPLSSLPSSTPSANTNHNHPLSQTTIGAIIGATLGPLILLLLVATVLVWRRYNRQRKFSTIGPGIPKRAPFEPESGMSERSQTPHRIVQF